MRFFALIAFTFFAFCSYGQQVVQIQLDVNEDLKILSDVTANQDSIPNGRYLVIYKNKTQVKGNTKDGKMDGYWTLYYPNGQQKLKARYVNGVPHGKWTLWGIKGDVQAKFQYNHGVPIGHWQGFYYNHAKAIDIIYTPTGNPTQCIQYYNDEIIALNHEYSYQNKLETKTLSYYYRNYNLFHYEKQWNNKRHGDYYLYHQNGLVWEHFYYREGKLTTVIESRSSGGLPRKNDLFRDGNGILNRYYSNGSIYSQTNYVNGLKNDSIHIFDMGGKNGGTGLFQNNIPAGKWEIYSKFHKLIFTLDFAETNPHDVFSKKSLSAAPKEIEKGTYKNGYRHGIWEVFDNYGELLFQTSYNYGFLNGKSKMFQSNKLMQEFNYINGNKGGKFTYYDSFGAVNTEETFYSDSFLDTNWYKSPQKDWVTVKNEEVNANQKLLWFYPDLPGMEITKMNLDFADQQEHIFAIQRETAYGYWPELIPAEMEGGAAMEKIYIANNLIIPKEALKQHVNGSVLLRYKVDELGLISDVVVLKSLGLGLDESATDIIKSLPPLNSATFNGIPIPSYVVRQIDFKF
tara:strand:- start:66798 stop:68510 length:1713 start_codon:yes stop_codon:yes gene_type:complete